MKKLYEGLCGNRKVYVILESGPKCELRHHIRHSPDGFSWGYLGSGCAELARCILWDHLGHEPHPALYQKFKADYVATWSIKHDWMLNADAIESWLYLNRQLPRKAHS